ncbi:pyridoxamine 5'-phosphate oxidase family protein [Sphaerisporangium sp. TRM90804]|uniref:pyridoxamine 5'-phosphate oxidase family protein n=1 Tax=Sphaerisporangium sp. TRM90804 TaxID=3031113 RepID=UPI002449F881|nr:pyridoxamine 5'-phosphate oxidase family protein [Sphaerisporangium sp. TRM90804]MDH2430816.1 pyridoxamine 5'-phosphate oxidase family protein [Sphaerisporangium sp. TRM90804]
MAPRKGSPGDLSRRIAHRRESLGLSRDQLAERAEMATGFIEYLEENPSSLDDGSLSRVARALDTTVEDLRGGGMDRPQGQGRASLHPSLERLDPEECLRLIEPGGIGRVAFDGSWGPIVLPVNYRLHQGSIVFRTEAGGPMDEDLRTGDATGGEFKIAFEVDRIDEAARAGWSVLVQGPAHHVPPEELPEVTCSEVEPWAGGERGLYIRVAPRRITGRRIHGL